MNVFSHSREEQAMEVIDQSSPLPVFAPRVPDKIHKITRPPQRFKIYREKYTFQDLQVTLQLAIFFEQMV